MPTQAERRAATRATLLDAAAEVLVERGLAGFTTTAVTDRAGVSNGALFRHFPTRLDLIAATVEHVLVRLRTTYETTFGDLPDRPDVETLLDLLWSAMSDTQFGAVLEVYTQARTDTDLLAAIHPIVAEHGDYVNALTARVAATLGDGTDTAPLAGLGSLAILAMQGLVVGQMAGASPGYERDVLADFRTLIDTLIDTGRSPTRTGAPS
ncbi:TetR family transcriptional regulator [Ilumatobacter fluminis]|uniref:TetR family transcriptional regulator n=1 Tax=Ilumatobacter fluminis TaxID=467091 RepID=A0A4R7I4Z1_9ACTN|nr:TetR/AcrR family transcriptional regulator [Ilumatobacter fluminis]TDT17806.1 TetR family transcriptional regulator [Ilumatobacter fluminis]